MSLASSPDSPYCDVPVTVQIAPEVLEAFRDRLEEYSIGLRYLIHNPILQDSLQKFMVDEKSAENIQVSRVCV
jgi:hypothetical protein